MSYSSNNIPAGYFLCNGTQFNQTAYPDLYNALGSNTIPDLRGLFLRGLDTAGTYDTDGPQRSLLEFQEGSYLINRHDGDGSVSFVWAGSGYLNRSNYCKDPVTFRSVGQSINKTAVLVGYGDSGCGWGGEDYWDNNIGIARPKNRAVNYIIKAYATTSGSDGSVSSVPTSTTSIAGFTGNTITQAFRVNSGVGTASGVGNLQVNFPQAFSGIPYVVAMPTREADYGAGLVPRFVDVNINNNDGTQPNITSTGFYMHVSARGGDTSRPWSVDIIAIGPA